MTKREFLNEVMAMNINDEMREVAQAMLNQLDKKSSKPTKAQIENEGIKAEIADLLADGDARTARDIANALGYSTNKVAALVKAIEGVEKIPGAKAKDAPLYRMG